jgi:hypothetical protein
MTDTLLRGGEITEGLRDIGPPSGRQIREAEPAWAKRMLEVAEIKDAALSGNDRAVLYIKESMSTSDFPLLLADVASREVAQTYEAIQPLWPRIAARTTVPDFKSHKVIDFLGGQAVLPLVPELDEYKMRAYTESQFGFSVSKRGAGFSWSWELGIMDNLRAMDRVPGSLAVAARRTEDYVVTSAIVDTDFAGPASGWGTPLTTPLTAANLQSALQTLSVRTDTDGFPIMLDAPILMVPPALAQTAFNIVNTTERRITVSGTEARVEGNGLQSTPEVVVNPFLVLDTDAKSPTTWYLFPGPNSARPAIYAAFLQGYETPDLRYQNDQGARPGGGAIGPAEGSFRNDSITYRERHVVGASLGFVGSTSGALVSTGS